MLIFARKKNLAKDIFHQNVKEALINTTMQKSLIALVLFAHGSLHAQQGSLTPTLLAPAGGFASNSSGSISWSMGEVAVDHLAGLTQGFQQPLSDSLSKLPPKPLPEDVEKLRLALPNFITPDGNLQNDVFDPVSILNTAPFNFDIDPNNTEMTILNRWGEIIFKARPYRAWEGKTSDKGHELPPATYYFKLLLQPGSKQIKGAVNLLK